MSKRSTVKLLTFDLGGTQIRGILQGQEVWLLVGDIAKAFGSTLPSHYSILAGMDKAFIWIDTPRGPREALVVNQESLITWAYRSRKAAAGNLRKWLADQIKPGLLQSITFNSVEGGLIVGKVGA